MEILYLLLIDVHWLFHQLKNDPPDVLHAHFAPVGCHFLDLAQRLDIPLVVSFYGYDFQRLPFEKPAYRQHYQQLFSQAAAITVTGPHTPKILEAQGCPTKKIIPIPLSISPEHFPWYQRTKLPGQLQLVQVATITEKKGHLDTLEAIRLLLPECPNIHLTIAGERQDKTLAKKIANFIKVNQLEKNVVVRDSLPHAALPQFLLQFDVFIHPSYSTDKRDSEGSPVVILEAQATGLPVLATTHADIPAQVVHGATGLLTPEKNAQDLSQSIKRFYFMENNEYQQFSIAARRHIEQNFDIKITAPKLQTLYLGALTDISCR